MICLSFLMADYYSDDMAEYRHSDDNVYELEEEEESDDTGDTNDSGKQNFCALKESDIKQCLEDDITTLSIVLSISTVEATILLQHYHWSLSDASEAWFADEDEVRKTLGLVQGPVIQFPSATEVTCGICFEVYPLDHISSAICGHPFCRTCWEGYINVSINDGPGCLTLRCPYPSCGAAVGQGMVNQLATDQDKEKYARYVLRSYVEESRTIKWCPAPGCECAVKFVLGSGSYDVTCICSHGFCWNCSEEAHRPLNCDTVSKWILKNSAESGNLTWILINAKSCPKCKRSIVKSQGCLHMTCPPPCKFEFCWLCLGAWSDHGGSFYVCNRYNAAKERGEFDEAEKMREIAKNSLNRYTHYYQRWITNHMSRQKALVDLKKLQIVQREKLSEKKSQPDTQLNILVDAWLQIVECRRVLKWTYAYGFYLPSNGSKKTFFEYLQGEAESALEKLHHCAENNLKSYMQVGSLSDFPDFGIWLDGLTKVTQKYFKTFVRNLENGLTEVQNQEEYNDNSGESENCLTEVQNQEVYNDNSGESDEEDEEEILRRFQRVVNID